MRIRTATVVVAAALSLAGCSASADTAAQGSPAPAHATRVPAETVRPPLVAPTPTPTPTPESPSNVTNARGNLVQAVGALSVMTNAAKGTLVEFTLTAVDANFTCTAPYARASENGHFIALTFDVTTTAALSEQPLPKFGMASYDFRVFSPDGTRENDSTGNGYGCVADSDALPRSMGPREHAVGKVILDSAQPAGSIVFSPSSVKGGLEWGF